MQALAPLEATCFTSSDLLEDMRRASKHHDPGFAGPTRVVPALAWRSVSCSRSMKTLETVECAKFNKLVMFASWWLQARRQWFYREVRSEVNALITLS